MAAEPRLGRRNVRQSAIPVAPSRTATLAAPCSHIMSSVRASSARISCEAARPAIPATAPAPTPSHHSWRPSAACRRSPEIEAAASTTAASGRVTSGAWTEAACSS